MSRGATINTGNTTTITRRTTNTGSSVFVSASSILFAATAIFFNHLPVAIESPFPLVAVNHQGPRPDAFVVAIAVNYHQRHRYYGTQHLRSTQQHLFARRHGALLITTAATTTTTAADDDEKSIHVVVVGGGVGGLAIAARLSTAAAVRTDSVSTRTDKARIRVTVLEKNSEAGGRCGSFDVTKTRNPKTGSEDEVLKFRHERGPSLLLLPHMYQQLFTDVTSGSKVGEDFGLYLKQCIPAYKVVFDDGDTVNLGFPNRDIFNTITQQQQEELNRLRSESRKMMNQFEVNGAQKWDDYMRLCRAYLECGLPNFVEERFDARTFPNFIMEGIVRNAGQSFPLKPHRDVLDSCFTSEKMCALASFQDLYVGLQPFHNSNNTTLIGGGVLQTTAPAVFGLLAAIELHPDIGGVYAPIGGFRAVQESLQNLAESYCNVVIQYNCTVAQVAKKGVYYYDTIDRDNVAVPTLKFLKSDVIVINADLPYAEQSLLPKQQLSTEPVDDTTELCTGTRHTVDHSSIREDDRAQLYLSKSQLVQTDEAFKVKYDWNDRYRFSSGVIAFHWSINQSLHELNTHNVFLSATNRTTACQSWDYVRNVTSSTSTMMTNINEPFNFYVHRASNTDRTAAPIGMDAIMILVPCPTLQRNEAYSLLPRNEAILKYKKEQFSDELIDRVRTAVLHRLAILPTLSTLQEYILHEVVDTPATYADLYNVGAGTPFGLSHGLQQLSVFRPPSILDRNKSSISNMFYCGASTRPGNGVPLVLTGAKLIADKVLKFVKDLR